MTSCLVLIAWSASIQAFAQPDKAARWAKQKFGDIAQDEYYLVRNDLKDRFATITTGTNLMSLPDNLDGSAISVANAGTHVTFSGRRLPVTPDQYAETPGFDDRTPIISSAAWYEVTSNEETGWIPGWAIAIEADSFDPQAIYREEFLRRRFRDEVPTEAIVSSPTLCYSDRQLRSPTGTTLATGQTVNILQRVYARSQKWALNGQQSVPGDDIYVVKCGGADAFASGRDLALLGGHHDYNFAKNAFVLVNPSGVWYYGPSGSYVRGYQMWLVLRGTRSRVVRLDCDVECRDFSSSPSGAWFWACGSFYSSDASRRCTPPGRFGSITWVDNRLVLMRALEEASLYLLNVPKCTVSRAVDLSTIVSRDECNDCTCQAVPWPAPRIDQAAGRIYFEADGFATVVEDYTPLIPPLTPPPEQYTPIKISSSVTIGDVLRKQ